MRTISAALAICAALATSAYAQPAAAAKRARVMAAPPKILSFVRQTLKRGAAAAYAGIETSIALRYHQARIPLYWVCLQSSKSPEDILYLNVYDNPNGPDRAAATYQSMVPKHQDLVRLQQRLQALNATPPTTSVTARRDEFVYSSKRDVDLATMGALRVTVFHVKAGHEGDFVDAAQMGRAVPWLLYEDTASPTFFLVVPLRTPSDRRDAGLPRGLRQVKAIYTADTPVVYVLRPAMSHAPPEYVAANARLRKTP